MSGEYAGNKELENYIREYEKIDGKIRELKKQAEELKIKIYAEMVDSKLERFSSPNYFIYASKDYRFEIPRDESDKVYALLESNGYDCKTNNSALRTKFPNRFLE